MCGIVGYIGDRPAAPILCRGIEIVEYRGYDSAGAAVIEKGRLVVEKFAGDPALTVEAISSHELTGTVGLAHTRWATHGDIVDRNAHPHLDCSANIAVVHNGIIWNHYILQSELARDGHVFASDCDSEDISHLVENFRRHGDALVLAVQKAANLLKESTFAFVVIDVNAPDEIVGACQGGELYVGLADHGTFLVSDHRAFREHTPHFVKVEDGTAVLIRRGEGPRFLTFDNQEVEHQVEQLWYAITEFSKGPYEHFMLAEMMFQADAMRNALEGRITDQDTIRLGGIDRHPSFRFAVQHQIRRAVFVACGTSKYSSDAAARHFQSLGIDAQAINAGEYVSSPIQVGPDTLVIPVSQSGITKEVLLAAERARTAGAHIWPIVNVPGSTLSRLGNGHGMYVQAGLETAVASTKAFTGQIINAAMLGYALADLRGQVDSGEVTGFCREARAFPGEIERMLSQAQSFVNLGAAYADTKLFLYLGKGFGMAAAEEGALKLKEIAYKPAFGLSASDLKHGPLAMLDGETLVIAICVPDDGHPQVYEWTVKNVEQVLSRHGKVIVVCEEGDKRASQLAVGQDRVQQALFVPKSRGILTTITSVIPLQFFAYGLARELAKTQPDVKIDKPRHIAKASSVE